MSVKSELKEKLKEILKIPSADRSENDIAILSELVSVTTHLGYKNI